MSFSFEFFNFVKFIPSSIKKRACRYLLQHYLGRFLETKLGLDQLSVDLYEGTGCVKDVTLDVDALNELSEEQGFPVEFLDGSIAEVSVSVPWSALLSESSFVEIKGLCLVIHPKQQCRNLFMLESMINSMTMTTSMQLAEGCLKQDDEDPINDFPQNTTYEGLELFAQALETVLARVKVRFVDTTIRVEYIPQGSMTGIGLEIHIKKIDYFDLAGLDQNVSEGESNVNERSAYATKKFSLEGVTLYSDEFAAADRTMSRSCSSTGGTSTSDSQSDESWQKNGEKGQTNLVLCGKLSGRHEISVRLKQCEALLGPKIELDVQLGSTIVFLSPRQLHSFHAIFSALMKPTSDINVKMKRVEKPMQPSDYRRIENELQQQIKQANLTGVMHGDLLTRKGWSTGNFDDSDEEFHPFNTSRSDKSPEHLNQTSKSSPTGLEHAFVDSPFNHTQRSAGRKLSNRNFTENAFSSSDEQCVRKMHFTFKLGSFIAILLHEDIIASNSASANLAASTVQELRSVSEFFFSQIGLLSLIGAGAKDLSLIRDKLDAACSKSHLRIIMAPLNMTGNEQGCSSGTTLEMTITVAVAEVMECLVEKSAPVPNAKFEHCYLLSFLPPSEPTKVKANMTVKLVTKEPSKVLQRVRNPMKPETQINIQLSPCVADVDMSIIDRITALLNSPGFLSIPNHKSQFSNMYQEKQPAMNAMFEDGSCSRTCLTVGSSLLIVKLRFPIPDLRPIHDLQRTPWWRRCVRPDILTLELYDANISTTLVPNETIDIYELVCKEAKGLYQENEAEEPIGFLHATAQEGDSVNMADGVGNFDLPRLTVTLRPTQNNSELEEDIGNESEEDPDIMYTSTGEALLDLTAQQPSPFSKRRLIHKGQNHRDDGSNMDELLVPGNSDEMTEFAGLASKNCLRQIDISLPKVNFVLPSKHFFEVLYNRLSTDLCLWEPSAPEFFTPRGGPTFDFNKPSSYGGLGSAVLQSPIPGMFIMCKSGVVYESDEESDEGESNHFSYTRNREWKAKKPGKDAPSKLCFCLKIGQGSGTLFCHVKDPVGTASLTHHGEVQCTIDDGMLFSVTSFQGDPNLGYVCFQAVKTSLSHNGYVFNSYEGVESPSKGINHQTSRVDQVLYPSSSDTLTGHHDVSSMLSVAVQIRIDERAHIKTFKTAVSVKGGTLRHRFSLVPHSWFTQVADFFDVTDYPIAGYRPPTVITELHLNLAGCAIDYRPLYLPARVFLTLGTLNVSSNIIAQTNSSVLRFVVEDAALHLSDKVSYGTVNLQRDYVCVLDIDLLELSLRLFNQNGGETTIKSPKFELQSSLNVVHLRTCADSCRLFLDLLTYLAEDGDLDEKGAPLSEDSSESGTTVKTGNGSIQSDCVSSIGQEMEAQVNDLMAEAMQESSPTSHNKKVYSRVSPKEESLTSPTEVFFFPDENKVKLPAPIQEMPESGEEPRGVWHDGVDNLMDDVLDPNCDDRPDKEEEFCILENDPGVGFTPRGGEPTVRRLIEGPVQLVESHFTPPIGKTDVLKAPKHFPVPIMRYTLREMTVIWEIFGGRDFPKHGGSSSSGAKSKTNHTVSFSKSSNREDVKIQSSAKNIPGSSLSNGLRMRSGGCNRQQDVKLELQMNKVRFQHEVYPDNTFEASRQVLAIGDIEIRDRLAHSHINKFLYQYCSEARPRQAHANMVLVKALHVRPDQHVPALECSLKVSILPLRLHIDQDTLFFMSEFSSALAETATVAEGEDDTIKSSPPSAPIMGVAGEAMNTYSNRPGETDSISIADSDTTVSPPVYFRSFSFSPDVLIRFDYHGKHVDLGRHGPLAGLLVGLAQLNCSQLTLKRLSHRHGLLGTNKLIAYALNEWLADIRKNQLPSVLGGVGPMHSIVQLVQGVRDLFWLPIEQFQKDGRIVRGLQRGANAFSTSAALAILELTSRMVQTLQSAAETAYDVVSPGPSVKRQRPGSRGRRRRYAQPVDIRDGVAKAYQVVKEGLGETAQTLVRVANEEAEQKGVTGAVGGVLRQIPPIVVKPIILATEATVNVLGGVQSQLMPDTRKEAIDKWRQDD